MISRLRRRVALGCMCALLSVLVSVIGGFNLLPAER